MFFELINYEGTVGPTPRYATLARKFNRMLQYSYIMKPLEKDIKEISRRMMTEKGQYYRDTSKYLNSIMRSASQEDLIEVFPKLDVHELKRCIAAGVPGHAMHAANEILMIKKDNLKHFEAEQIGQMRVEYETDNIEEPEKDAGNPGV